MPDAVVFAESAEEVQAIVQLCARHKTPIIPFGTGTSLEGHISAPNGGISLDPSGLVEAWISMPIRTPSTSIILGSCSALECSAN